MRIFETTKGANQEIWDGARLMDKPMAAEGLISYRYSGRYGYIMIGARDDLDALIQAKRSMTSGEPDAAKLEKWDGEKYKSVLS